MKSILQAVLCFLGMMAGAEAAESLDFSSPDPEATSMAEKVLEPWLADARAAGASYSVSALRRDLNDDEAAEIVGRLDSAYICGGMGPCFFVIRDDDGKRSVVLNVPGVDIAEILDATTNGWHDLKFTSMSGDAVWRWSGETYEMN